MVTFQKTYFSLVFIAIFIKFIFCEESSLRNLYDPTTDPVYDEMYYVRNIECSSFTNCLAPNVCLDDSTCKCAEGFINLPPPVNSTNTTDTIPLCQYKQKFQVNAFLLQFFVLHGTGHFYVGNLNYAIPQLIICLCPTILYSVMCIFGITLKNSDGSRGLINIIFVLLTSVFFLTMVVWWFVDVITFGTNSYNDSNGIPLRSW